MPKKNRCMYILTAITALAAAVIGGFLPILQKHIIDDAIAGELRKTGFFHRPSLGVRSSFIHLFCAGKNHYR